MGRALRIFLGVFLFSDTRRKGCEHRLIVARLWEGHVMRLASLPRSCREEITSPCIYLDFWIEAGYRRDRNQKHMAHNSAGSSSNDCEAGKVIAQKRNEITVMGTLRILFKYLRCNTFEAPIG